MLAVNPAEDIDMAKRTWIIEEAVDEDGTPLGVFDRGEAADLMQDLLGTLASIGGMASFAARRVKTGQTPLGETAASVELVVQWQAFSPMETTPAPVLDEEPPEGDDPDAPDLMDRLQDSLA